VDLTETNQKMKEWLVELGAFIQAKTDYDIDEKAGFRDLVSEVDVAVENKLTEYIRSLPGQQEIIGEEGSNAGVDANADHLWVIDPIDGTSNFVKQADDYGILVAYFQKGEPQLSYLYEVETNTLVSAQKDVGIFINDEPISPPANLKLNEAMISINPRKMNGTDLLTKVAEEGFDLRFLGSSVSDALRVVVGKYGAFISPESEPWDRAPYILFAEELNLQMSQFDGSETTLIGDESFFFGTKAIYEEVFKADN
jgi:fructose-1,6-bisphosphatase/inositol monophosphatase family enzyme